ncbi:hypothetical protein TWF281_003269 [Arthrobotrys megalospora]
MAPFSLIPIGNRSPGAYYDKNVHATTLMFLLTKPRSDVAEGGNKWEKAELDATYKYLDLADPPGDSNGSLTVTPFGTFDITGNNAPLSEYAENIRIKGWVLTADLWSSTTKYIDDGYTDHASYPKDKLVKDVSINLNFCIFTDRAEDGNSIAWLRPSENIVESGAGFILSGSTLYAHIVGRDGRLHAVDLDLSQKLGSGTRGWRYPGDSFTLGGKNFRLMEEQSRLLIIGDLWKSDGVYETEWFDLSKVIKVERERIGFGDPPGPFDKSGSMTLWLETVPYICWLTAVAHVAAGNTLEAKRAAAKSVCTMAVFSASTAFSIVGGSAAGAFVAWRLATAAGSSTAGALLGASTAAGSIVGACLGAAIGTGVGLKAQDIVASATGAPDISELTLETWLDETLTNVLAAGAGAGLSQLAGAAVRMSLAKSFSTEVIATVSEELVDKAGGTVYPMGVVAMRKSFLKLLPEGQRTEEPLQ